MSEKRFAGYVKSSRFLSLIPQKQEIAVKLFKRCAAVDEDGLAGYGLCARQPEHGIGYLVRVGQAFERHHLGEAHHLGGAVLLGGERQAGRDSIDPHSGRERAGERFGGTAKRLFRQGVAQLISTGVADALVKDIDHTGPRTVWQCCGQARGQHHRRADIDRMVEREGFDSHARWIIPNKT